MDNLGLPFSHFGSRTRILQTHRKATSGRQLRCWHLSINSASEAPWVAEKMTDDTPPRIPVVYNLLSIHQLPGWITWGYLSRISAAEHEYCRCIDRATSGCELRCWHISINSASEAPWVAAKMPNRQGCKLFTICEASISCRDG